MVKLGLISDSHFSSFWVEQYLQRANREKYGAVFFMGDGDSDARWLERRLDMPLIWVAGNCDHYAKHQREAFASFEGHRILAVHGDRFDVRRGLERLSYYAEEQGAEIALFGHTHHPYAGYSGRTLMINPGALNEGRCGELLLDGKRVVPYLLDLKEDE